MAEREYASARDMLTAYEERCANTDDGIIMRELLDRIGDKWALLVIGTLAFGQLRFGDLRAHIPGVSQRMLTITLRHLERDGLVTRTAFAEIPPRVEYALSPLGHSLVKPASALATWAIERIPEIRAARAHFDADT
ncbi:winged helix-turn-helix transcriptional regulator [Microbacterium sp.]|uniref:winged helix-turn-helix transcriptional regulator n=1 Tax=Microbacterium sp. TaxID=51671 RepID=UPI003A88133E